jgi:hypothetical protein
MSDAPSGRICRRIRSGPVTLATLPLVLVPVIPVTLIPVTLIPVMPVSFVLIPVAPIRLAPVSLMLIRLAPVTIALLTVGAWHGYLAGARGTLTLRTPTRLRTAIRLRPPS